MNYYVTGMKHTEIGEILCVATILSRRDRWGAFKARLGIGRMSYTVEPGLYAAGDPDQDSPVLVTANYKLSFDTLRKNLDTINAWILVLNTDGINVWCAAGKGTFGTEELAHRVEEAGLSKIVEHRKLILPQLGAPGVAAHKVKDITGFSVVYGPVRADDIPAFLENGMKADPGMRRVTFTMRDRLTVVPVEIMLGKKYLAAVIAFFILTAGLSSEGYSFAGMRSSGIRAALILVSAFLSGTVLGPMLLPWLPGRSFSLKGVFAAVPVIAGIIVWPGCMSLLETGGWICLTAAFTSFMVMNFTGATPVTSLSGVKKEMRIAVPLQIAGVIIGTVLWIISRFV